MCPLASCEAKQAAPCDALVPGSWQCTTHAEAATQAFGANAPKRPCLCAICAKRAMHLRVLLPCRESEQTAPRDALLFGSWQCNTYTAICNIKRFALSGLVHPHCDALVPGSWQCTTHAEAVAQAFGANASKRPCLCAICAKQAMHLRVLLPCRESDQTAPRDALLFRSWQCNTYAAKCNIRSLGPSASTQRCLCAICAT